MKLAFSGKGTYPDLSDGYALYAGRSRDKGSMDEKTYNRIVKAYCKILAERLLKDGMVDLPARLGSLSAATITRKGQYRGDKFIGFGKMDWEKGHYDGKLKTFGVVFLPNRSKSQCLRSYGFVTNRQLFKRMKARSEEFPCPWAMIKFSDEMI